MGWKTRRAPWQVCRQHVCSHIPPLSGDWHFQVITLCWSAWLCWTAAITFKHKKEIHSLDAYVCAESLNSCPTLCDLMDCSLSGSSVHGTLQARILERVAEPSFKGSSQPRDQTLVSYISALAGGFFTTSITGNLLTPFKSQAQS